MLLYKLQYAGGTVIIFLSCPVRIEKTIFLEPGDVLALVQWE